MVYFRHFKLQSLLRQGKDPFRDYNAISINKDRLRKAGYAIIDRGRALDGILDIEIADFIFLQELLCIAGLFGSVDADKDHTLRLQTRPRFLQKWRFLVAGGAPRGPEIHNYRLPLEVRETNFGRASQDGQGEVRRSFADQRAID